MAIAKGYKGNFHTLVRAARNSDLMLLECTDAQTGKPVMVVCAVYKDSEGMINTVPLAKMFDGNPFEELLPPNINEANTETL